MDCEQFDVQHDKVARWMSAVGSITGFVCCGVGWLVVWVLMRLGLRKLVVEWADSLSYRVEGDVLYGRQKYVFTDIEKAVPMDKITDVIIMQGPVQRHFDIWALHVQTAGQGGMRAELVMHGLADPHAVRKLLLERMKMLRQ